MLRERLTEMLHGKNDFVKNIFETLNPFNATGLFPYPLQKSENLFVFLYVLWGYKKRQEAWNGLKWKLA